MTRGLFKPPAPKDAPEGRPTERTTRLSAALRKLPLDGFEAGKRDSLANQLDRVVASTGYKGELVKNLYAYRQAAAYYRLHTGKDFGSDG